MSQDFEAAVRLILENEGGYTNNPSDPGNWTGGKVGEGELKGTKFGVSAAAYPHLNIVELTRADAVGIFKRDYWNPVASRVPEGGMRLMVVDAAYNHGVQRALTWFETYRTQDEYTANRLRFYASLDTFPTFARGWTRRVAKVLEAIDRLTHQKGNRALADVLVDNRGVFTRLLAALRGKSGPIAYNVRPTTAREGIKLDVDAA